MKHNAWKLYAQGQTLSNDPVQNTLLLYDRMILDLRNAKECITKLQYVKSDEFLLHAEVILRRLIMQVDPTPSEEMANSFYDMYGSWYKLLRYEMVYKEGTEIDALIALVEDIRNTFLEVAKKDGKS